MDLRFKTIEKPVIEDKLTKKIKWAISFQQWCMDEEYYSHLGEDYDAGFIAWLQEALKIIETCPPEIREKIIYKEQPTDKVYVQKEYVYKHIFKESSWIVKKLLKIIDSNPTLTDEMIKHKYRMDMVKLRKIF
jgi:hypothetical protein